SICILLLHALALTCLLHSFPTRRSSDLVHYTILRRQKVPLRYGLQAPDPDLREARKKLFPNAKSFLRASRRSGSGACNPYLSGKDRKSTRLNSSHVPMPYAVLCVKKIQK